MTTTEPTPWIKARQSSSNGSCIELRASQAGVEVRDSKAGESGPILRFTPGGFAALLDDARRGEFDKLLD